MANRWKGNFVVATAATSSGTAYTGKANGSWSLNNQIQQKQAGLWARAVGVPAAPTIGTVTAGNAQANITFTAPSDNGGQTITGYTVISSPSSIVGAGTSSPITVTGLTNGTAYTFTVAAINASGTGAYSSTSSSVTPVATSVPDSPTIISAVQASRTSATISFTAPSYNGNSPILNYTVRSSPNNITASINQSGSGSITITGLPAQENYTFTLTATNAVGTSAASSPSASVFVGLNPGQAYEGGYFAGQTLVSGTKYNIIVAPKSTGQISSTAFSSVNVLTNINSPIDGSTNSAALSALGTAYAAARFCENLTIGGYTDWYLPAEKELEVAYFFLKPTTTLSEPGSGANPYAVSPEPINTEHSSSSPVQTTSALFKSTGSECFDATLYWTSTESSDSTARIIYFTHGIEGDYPKTVAASSTRVRAIRKVPA